MVNHQLRYIRKYDDSLQKELEEKMEKHKQKLQEVLGLKEDKEEYEEQDPLDNIISSEDSEDAYLVATDYEESDKLISDPEEYELAVPDEHIQKVYDGRRYNSLKKDSPLGYDPELRGNTL